MTYTCPDIALTNKESIFGLPSFFGRQGLVRPGAVITIVLSPGTGPSLIGKRLEEVRSLPPMVIDTPDADLPGAPSAPDTSTVICLCSPVFSFGSGSTTGTSNAAVHEYSPRSLITLRAPWEVAL